LTAKHYILARQIYQNNEEKKPENLQRLNQLYHNLSGIYFESVNYYLKIGNESYQLKKHSEAIDNFNNAIHYLNEILLLQDQTSHEIKKQIIEYSYKIGISQIALNITNEINDIAEYILSLDPASPLANKLLKHLESSTQILHNQDEINSSPDNIDDSLNFSRIQEAENTSFNIDQRLNSSLETPQIHNSQEIIEIGETSSRNENIINQNYDSSTSATIPSLSAVIGFSNTEISLDSPQISSNIQQSEIDTHQISAPVSAPQNLQSNYLTIANEPNSQLLAEIHRHPQTTLKRLNYHGNPQITASFVASDSESMDEVEILSSYRNILNKKLSLLKKSSSCSSCQIS
jgi:tetratricopeptide (TPR) repeat protein